jgi:hypothetical protein
VSVRGQLALVGASFLTLVGAILVPVLWTGLVAAIPILVGQTRFALSVRLN